MDIVVGLFLVIFAAVIGGFLAKTLKVPSLVGYIISGIVFGAVLPENLKSVTSLAQLGAILLLFSIGIELSLNSLLKFIKVAVYGSIIQIILVTFFAYFFLHMFGLNVNTSFILALGFSLSSTAVVVKLLSDRGELDTIHGRVMMGWLLVQDLAVIPIMVILPVLGNFNGNWVSVMVVSLIKAFSVVFVAVFLGKMVIPKIIHQISSANSRELLLLSSVGLAFGTAAATSYFGISPGLGAFLAGIVISESQEHHAVFAETRPLRDLFVALFFVSLGFLIPPSVIFNRFGQILLITLFILILKAVVVFFVSNIFGFKGRTAIANSFGLSQVGEFAFVIFSSALGLNLISSGDAALGISVTLLSLIVAPLLIRSVVPFWRSLRNITAKIPFLFNLVSTGEKRNFADEILVNHIVICGYGRVGKWVGKVLTEFNIPFVVIDYNQSVVTELKELGIPVFYGDPVEPEVLEAVNIRGAKVVILAIPDRVAQETLITYTQTVAPSVKIISRTHLDEDWEKLKDLRIDKIVQPEFEAAVEIVRTILGDSGKTPEDIKNSISRLRMSHSKR